MTNEDLMYEADLIAALGSVADAWEGSNTISTADAASQLEHLAAVAEGKSDYATFSEATNLTLAATSIH